MYYKYIYFCFVFLVYGMGRLYITSVDGNIVFIQDNKPDSNFSSCLLEVKLPYAPVCPSVSRSFGRSVGLTYF